MGFECVIQCFLSSEFESLLKVNQEALQEDKFHVLIAECCQCSSRETRAVAFTDCDFKNHRVIVSGNFPLIPD